MTALNGLGFMRGKTISFGMFDFVAIIAGVFYSYYLFYSSGSSVMVMVMTESD
jgi:hypothetical protein